MPYKGRIKKKAQELIKSLKLKSAPIPIEDVAKALGAKVIYSPLNDDHSGMIYAERNGRIIIGINSFHHPNRQRFTLAHEIAHLVLHKKDLLEQVHIDKNANGRRLNRDNRSSEGEDKMEIEANKFAAELLMPTEMVEKDIKHKSIDIEDEEAVVKLAKKYQVSVQSMSIKLDSILH
ncbi:MAG: ImmA/IrrE family metallo-endopeptidase [Micavibrio sp.]|nr:MAG: ImmA/IrrE family metallo-endopeptidase [Micavibrio sp.]